MKTKVTSNIDIIFTFQCSFRYEEIIWYYSEEHIRITFIYQTHHVTAGMCLCRDNSVQDIPADHQFSYCP